MASTAEIIAVVAAGGALGYILWKRTTTPAAPADPCAGLDGYALAACKALGLVPGVVTLLGDAAGALTTDDYDDYRNERTRRRTNNDALNGAAVPNLSSDVAATDNGTAPFYASIDDDRYQPASAWPNTNPASIGPFRYANGCEPYYGAPGWSKCAPGTLDEYEMAVQQATGGAYDEARATVPQVFETPAELQAAIDAKNKAHDPDNHWYQVSLGAGFSARPVEKLNKDHYGTGASGDPLTQGPWVDPSGKIWFLVRGVRLQVPTDKVPLAIAMRARGPMVAGQTQADVDAKIKALSDAQAVSLIGVGTYGAGSGTGTTTTYTGCAQIIADPTLTWDGQGWARLRVGEQRNLGPCAKSTTNGKGEIHVSPITLTTTGWENSTP